jgi:DNA-binding GntR family transcriptional regulator
MIGNGFMDNRSKLIELLCTKLAHSDNTPLYITIADGIKQAVQFAILRQGDFLPSERDLSNALGISRITVRKALELLHEQNFVTRSQGYGTVINSKLEYSLKDAKGFSQQVVLNGKKPNTVWVNKAVVPCNEDVATRLNLSVGSDVFLLKRIRYIDDAPVSIEESYVPITLIDDVEDIGLSLYDYFSHRNIHPQRSKSWVNAKMPDKEFQSHIKLEKQIPILLIRQVAFDGHNNPIEYSINHCRGDMYIFVADE